jgi:anaphase-promoting complex subunit 6
MDKHLREWRQQAVDRAQYDTAVYVGDKLLAITGDDADALWLAQVHFTAASYSRALALIPAHVRARNAQAKYLAAHCLVKLARCDDALQLLGDTNPQHLQAPASQRAKLRHVHQHSRDTHDTTAHTRLPTSEERDAADHATLRAEAAMCYLRGLCYARQNAFDRARDCYQTAVRIDVQCFEAFDALMANALMAPDDEWAFVDSLDFDRIPDQEAAHFTRTLYTTRLSKYARPDDFTNATETLTTHYRLHDNPDILLARADLMYTQCRFRDALDLTSMALARDRHNFAVLPLHIACLYELGHHSALFLLSHDMSDAHPDEPAAMLAIAVHYLLVGRIADARRFFSKASVMDPHFGPAWIGFAHTFAAEGEHDQAISAYSTAARLFQGTHLPHLFLGMQNLQLANLALAREYFRTAYQLCDTDPLLLNEMGIVAYNQDQLPDAVQRFRRALHFSERNQADADAALPMRTNLAHALRRSGHLDEALDTYDAVLRHGTQDAGVFTAKALVLLELGRSLDALTALHDALRVAPQDPMATDLMNRALEASEDEPLASAGAAAATAAASFDSDATAAYRAPTAHDDADVAHLERRINGQLREIEQNRVAGRRGRRRRAPVPAEDMSALDESMLVDSDG